MSAPRFAWLETNTATLLVHFALALTRLHFQINSLSSSPPRWRLPLCLPIDLLGRWASEEWDEAAITWRRSYPNTHSHGVFSSFFVPPSHCNVWELCVLQRRRREEEARKRGKQWRNGNRKSTLFSPQKARWKVFFPLQPRQMNDNTRENFLGFLFLFVSSGQARVGKWIKIDFPHFFIISPKELDEKSVLVSEWRERERENEPRVWRRLTQKLEEAKRKQNMTTRWQATWLSVCCLFKAARSEWGDSWRGRRDEGATAAR